MHSLQNNNQDFSKGKSINVKKWDELVCDLWEEKYLRHLWEAAVDFEETDNDMFTYDPSTGIYGFQDWEQLDSEEEFFNPQVNKEEEDKIVFKPPPIKHSQSIKENSG